MRTLELACLALSKFVTVAAFFASAFIFTYILLNGEDAIREIQNVTATKFQSTVSAPFKPITEALKGK